MQATVHHNSRHAACTVSEDQAGLKPYEMRVYIGTRGAAILHIAEGTKEIVVHRDNVDIHLPKYACGYCGYTGNESEFLEMECPACCADIETGEVSKTSVPKKFHQQT